VNTAAFGAGTKIGSIRQALNLLGRNQLTRWIQLLLYSLDDNGAFPPHCCNWRQTRQADGIAARHASHELGVFQERSHMAGMLSLADALLGMSMQEIVTILNPEDDLRDALLERKAASARCCLCAKSLEAADFDQVEMLANTLHIPMQTILKSQGEAMAWVCMLSDRRIECRLLARLFSPRRANRRIIQATLLTGCNRDHTQGNLQGLRHSRIVGKTLTPDIVEAIGQAIGSEATARRQTGIVIGYDGRLSGPELAAALARGIRKSGIHVIDIGMVAPPCCISPPTTSAPIAA